jgi:sialidase-1
MKRLISSLIVVSIFVTGCARHSAERQTVFLSCQTDSIPYRIPAMTELKDGSIMILADYRHCMSDIGFGRVDIRGRKLDSKGRRWSDEFILIEGTGIKGATDCGYGDPAVVTDRENNEILVSLVCGNTVYWHSTTTRENPNRIALMRSLDGGKSWSIKEVTEDIYSLFDEAPGGCVQSCFIASGKIFQSSIIKTGSHYRIYAALTARPNGNRVKYSDDFGRTWKVLGGLDELPVPYGDEAKCEELPDGSLIISSRAYGGRYFNIYTYTDTVTGSGSWADAAPSGKRLKGCIAVENSCNGELLIIPAIRKEDGKDVYLALQSVPFGPKRRDVGIYSKEIDVSSRLTPEELASDWNMKYQISQTWSAYSTMMQLRNGDIAFYYEESHEGSDDTYDMIYRELSIEEITSGRYTAKR